MEIYLYILENQKDEYYTGISKFLPKVRLERHNNGDVAATKRGRPWKVIYHERFGSYLEARKREKQIKSWHGGNAFKKLVARTAGSSNGRTGAFEAPYPGSNPGPAVLAGSNKNLAG